MASFDQLVDDKSRAPAGASGSFDSLVDDEDKYGGVLGETKAFGAGAARGATFGLSDQAMTRSGLVNPETLKGLQDTNPVSSGVGELTGIVAPALLGDEAGLANLPGTLAKLGTHAEGTAALMGAGKVASKVVGHGLEGAGYGLGQSVSENALGEHDIVSEKTLANIGLSAAFMGGIGGLVGKFGKEAIDTSSAADKFAMNKIESMAAPGSEEAVLAQTDLSAEDKYSFLQKFKSQKPQANMLRAEFKDAGLPEVLGMMSDNKTIQKFASAVGQLPTMAGDAVRRDVDAGYNTVNAILKDSFSVIPGEMMDRESGGSYVKDLIRNKFDEMMEPLKQLYKDREILGKGVDISDDKSLKVYDDLIEQSQKFREPTNEGRKVIEGAANDFLKNASEGGGMANLDAYAKTLSSKAQQARIAGDHDLMAAYYQVRDTVDKFLDEHLAELGKQVEKEGIEGAGDEAQNAIAQFKDMRKGYAKFKGIFSDLAETTGLGKKATTEGGLHAALDRVPNEQFVDKVFDPKNAKGLQNIKENFPEVFQALTAQKKSQMYQNALVNKNFNPLQLLKEINNEQKLSKGVKNLLFTPEQLKKMETADKWVRNLPDKLGPSGTPEGMEYMEMAKNPIKSLIGHGINEAGSAVSKRLIEGLMRPGEEAQLKSLLNINKAQDKIDKGISSRVKSIFSSSAWPVTGKVISKMVSGDDFHEKADQIREDANNPIKTMDKLGQQTDAMYAHAPNVTDSMKMAFIRGTQFLNSKLPISEPDIFGEKPDPSPAQISKFERYYHVVENPLVALDQVKDGTIVPETIETLRSVYPGLYQQMSQDLISGISDMKKDQKLTFQTKQAMSLFLGQPLDANLKGNNVQMTQSVFAQDNARRDAQQQQPKGNKSGMGKLSIADRSGVNQHDVDA